MNPLKKCEVPDPSFGQRDGLRATTLMEDQCLACGMHILVGQILILPRLWGWMETSSKQIKT